MQLTEQALLHCRRRAPINDTFSHEGLKSLLEQAAMVLPQHPVKPGDTWQGSSQINSPAGTLDS